MKKIIVILASLVLAFSVSAQDYTQNGKTFIEIEKGKPLTTIKTDYIWQDKTGEKHVIYITRNNACYILKTSKKTGKEYKQYLSKELSRKIALEIGRRIKAEEQK